MEENQEQRDKAPCGIPAECDDCKQAYCAYRDTPEDKAAPAHEPAREQEDISAKIEGGKLIITKTWGDGQTSKVEATPAEAFSAIHLETAVKEDVEHAENCAMNIGCLSCDNYQCDNFPGTSAAEDGLADAITGGRALYEARGELLVNLLREDGGPIEDLKRAVTNECEAALTAAADNGATAPKDYVDHLLDNLWAHLDPQFEALRAQIKRYTISAINGAAITMAAEEKARLAAND